MSTIEKSEFKRTSLLNNNDKKDNKVNIPNVEKVLINLNNEKSSNETNKDNKDNKDNKIIASDFIKQLYSNLSNKIQEEKQIEEKIHKIENESHIHKSSIIVEHIFNVPEINIENSQNNQTIQNSFKKNTKTTDQKEVNKNSPEFRSTIFNNSNNSNNANNNFSNSNQNQNPVKKIDSFLIHKEEAQKVNIVNSSQPTLPKKQIQYNNKHNIINNINNPTITEREKEILNLVNLDNSSSTNITNNTNIINKSNIISNVNSIIYEEKEVKTKKTYIIVPTVKTSNPVIKSKEIDISPKSKLISRIVIFIFTINYI